MNGHVMGLVLIQGVRHVCYHFKYFMGWFLTTLVVTRRSKVVKKCKHYPMPKDTIINIDHHPL